MRYAIGWVEFYGLAEKCYCYVRLLFPICQRQIVVSFLVIGVEFSRGSEALSGRIDAAQPELDIAKHGEPPRVPFDLDTLFQISCCLLLVARLGVQPAH